MTVAELIIYLQEFSADRKVYVVGTHGDWCPIVAISSSNGDPVLLNVEDF